MLVVTIPMHLINKDRSATTTGSCSNANSSSCSVSGFCEEETPKCYCDSLCCRFDDCCSDAGSFMCPNSTEQCMFPTKSCSCNHYSQCYDNTANDNTANSTQLKVITKPLNQSILQHEQVEMECFVRSSLPQKFMWKLIKNGRSELVADGHNPLTPDYFIKLGEKSQVLIIKRAEWEHGGVYKCSISTSNDTVEADAKLNVLGKYMIIISRHYTHINHNYAHTSITIQYQQARWISMEA